MINNAKYYPLMWPGGIPRTKFPKPNMAFGPHTVKQCIDVIRAEVKRLGARTEHKGGFIVCHPNRIPFEGVLTLVDRPSTKSPAGARGHRVILTRAAALEAIPSLVGMAIGFTPHWDGHDERRKCGVITRAHISGNELWIGGYIYGRDFPEVVQQVRGRRMMGLSYEMDDAHIADMRANVWEITRATFTGAALLLQEKAAYRGTCFYLMEAMAI